jgi:hypothetical protein
MHAGDHHVEALEQLRLLVEGTVFEDVDLDAGEDPKRRNTFAEFVDDVELFAQPVRRQPVGDGQPRRVIGERAVFVSEVAGGQHHLLDRR